jgi:hypothetical protein
MLHEFFLRQFRHILEFEDEVDYFDDDDELVGILFLLELLEQL